MQIGLRLTLFSFSIIVFGVAIYCIRKREFNLWVRSPILFNSTIYRDKEPVFFWLIVTLYIACGIFLLLTSFADYFFYYWIKLHR